MQIRTAKGPEVSVAQQITACIATGSQLILQKHWLQDYWLGHMHMLATAVPQSAAEWRNIHAWVLRLQSCYASVRT